MLALLISHITSSEFTPDNIKHDFHPHWDAEGHTYSSDEDNKGEESVRTAIEMVNLLRTLSRD